MGTALSFREITSLDMVHDHHLQQWLETHRLEKGVYYKREGEKIYILISGGQRPSGGYKVIIDQAVKDSLNKVHISAHVKLPKPDVMVIQTLTYPYACIQIEGEDIKDVHGILME